MEVSRSVKTVYKALKRMCGTSNRCRLIIFIIRGETNFSHNKIYRILSKYNRKLWDIDDKENVLTLREDEGEKILKGE